MHPDQIDRLIERVAVGVPSQGGLQVLSEELERHHDPNTYKIGDRPLIVDHDRYVQVGERCYYGLDAVRIRAAIAPEPAGHRPATGWGGWRRLATSIFCTSVFAVAAGIAVSALALVPQGQPSSPAKEHHRAGITLGFGFSLIASGAIGMRNGNALRGPDTA